MGIKKKKKLLKGSQPFNSLSLHFNNLSIWAFVYFSSPDNVFLKNNLHWHIIFHQNCTLVLCSPAIFSSSTGGIIFTQKTAVLNYSPQFLRVSLSKGILQLVPSVFPDFFFSSSAHTNFLSRPNQHPTSVPPPHITMITSSCLTVDTIFIKPLTMSQTVNVQKILADSYKLLPEPLTLILSRNFSTI